MPELSFALSDVVAGEAAAAFATHERRIRARLPDVEVRHTGGTSIPGVLTSADVDLHVRTDRESFEAARDALLELYEPIHREGWHSEGAFFAAPGSDPPVELALTATGSLDDLHHGEAWQLIAANPNLIERYNTLKRAHRGGSPEEYQTAKRAFFYDNFRR